MPSAAPADFLFGADWASPAEELRFGVLPLVAGSLLATPSPPSALPARVPHAVPLNVNGTRLYHPSRLSTNLERTSVSHRRLLGQTFTPV